MDLQYRIADKDDIIIIYEMMLAAKSHSESQGIYQWDDNYPTIAMLEHDVMKGDTRLVYNDNQCVAFYTSNSVCEDDVHGHINWLNPNESWVFFHRLCVDPKFQDKGIGTRIVKNFIELNMEQFDSIRIDVFSTNAKALHIYEQLGFTNLGVAYCERGAFYVLEKMIG